MHLPLLSIVIPTHNRPQFLLHAINSALQAAPDGDVEVIVVPNGADELWKSAAKKFHNEPRVQWHWIKNAHGNAARNHGKRLSRGKYIRFLDDDDVLLPEGAQQQLIEMDSKKEELCSGTIDIVDGKGRLIKHYPHASQEDFFVAMAPHNRLCLPTAHLFKREALVGFDWNESIRYEQDTDWMINLAAKRDWHWLPVDIPVGQWCWHEGQRVSESITSLERAVFCIYLLRRALKALRVRNALSEFRHEAIIDSVMHYTHSNFHHSPIFFSKVMAWVRKKSPSSRPADPFYHLPVVRNINPIPIEWLMVPKRKLNDFFRY